MSSQVSVDLREQHLDEVGGPGVGSVGSDDLVKFSVPGGFFLI